MTCFFLDLKHKIKKDFRHIIPLIVAISTDLEWASKAVHEACHLATQQHTSLTLAFAHNS